MRYLLLPLGHACKADPVHALNVSLCFCKLQEAIGSHSSTPYLQNSPKSILARVLHHFKKTTAIFTKLTVPCQRTGTVYLRSSFKVGVTEERIEVGIKLQLGFFLLLLYYTLLSCDTDPTSEIAKAQRPAHLSHVVWPGQKERMHLMIM